MTELTKSLHFIFKVVFVREGCVYTERIVFFPPTLIKCLFAPASIICKSFNLNFLHQPTSLLPLEYFANFKKDIGIIQRQVARNSGEPKNCGI